MSSTVYVMLSALGVLTVAYVCRDRQVRRHLAETPLAVALRRTSTDDPRHRAEGAGLVQHAVSITPAVGLALVVAGTNAVASAPTPEPVAAAVSVVPVLTPADATSVPVSFDDRDISHMKRALFKRMRAKKAKVSRTLRRANRRINHVKPLSSAPKPNVAKAPKPVVATVKPAPVHHVPTPRKPVSTSAPKPVPRTTVTPKATGTVRTRIISIAKTALGLPYVYGAETPGVAFDCSGLTEWVFSKVGVNLPRTSQDQYRSARRVSTPRPGDLVFYLGSGGAYHVGIFYKPGYMIAAPHTGTDVQIQSIWGSPVYATVL